MAWQIKFNAFRGADWFETIELFNAETSEAMDVSAYDFELGVQDSSDSQLLTASTLAGTITRPTTNQIKWRFTATEMAALCNATTYSVGCRFTDENDQITQLFTGSLSFIDGEVS